MDPISAAILGSLFAVGVDKVRKKGLDAKADWEAIKRGEETPSHKLRQQITAAQEEAIRNGAVDPTRMTPTEYARVLNSIGKQPGVGLLLSTQYRNMVSAANRRLSSYWDEKERRAIDPEYARRVDEEKNQAKRQAHQRRQDRKNKFKTGASKAKEKARNAGAFFPKGGFDVFNRWLEDQLPEDTKPTTQPETEPGSGPEPGAGKEPGPETTPGPNTGEDNTGPAKEPPPGEGTTPGPGPETGPEPPGSGQEWGRAWKRKGGINAEEERQRRRGEYGDWVRGNQRYGETTVWPVYPEPDPEPEPGPGPAGALTRGTPALDPAQPGHRPDTTPGGTPPMSNNGNGNNGSSGGGSLPQRAPSQQVQDSARRQGGNAPARPSQGGRPAQGTGGGATGGGDFKLSSQVKTLYRAIETMQKASTEVQDVADVLDVHRAGPGLTEALRLWSANLARDLNHGLQVAGYLNAAEQHIGAAANQYTQAPKNLEMYQDG